MRTIIGKKGFKGIATTVGNTVGRYPTVGHGRRIIGYLCCRGFGQDHIFIFTILSKLMK